MWTSNTTQVKQFLFPLVHFHRCRSDIKKDHLRVPLDKPPAGNNPETFLPLAGNRLPQWVGRTEVLLFYLLPGVELLVGSEEDVLVAQLIDRHSSLASDHCVNPTNLVGHLPSNLKAPLVVVTVVSPMVPIPAKVITAVHPVEAFPSFGSG